MKNLSCIAYSIIALTVGTTNLNAAENYSDSVSPNSVVGHMNKPDLWDLFESIIKKMAELNAKAADQLPSPSKPLQTVTLSDSSAVYLTKQQKKAKKDAKNKQAYAQYCNDQKKLKQVQCVSAHVYDKRMQGGRHSYQHGKVRS